MDKIEHLVWFILAALVALAPLGMLACSLRRKREKNRYIVEIWNADRTRLLATIIATDDDRLPGIGIVQLRENPADRPEDSPEPTEAGVGNVGGHASGRTNLTHLRYEGLAPQSLSCGKRADKDRLFSPSVHSRVLNLPSTATQAPWHSCALTDCAVWSQATTRRQTTCFTQLPASSRFKFFGRKSVVLETSGVGSQSFHGRVVVLLNEYTTGAAEMLAQFVQENAWHHRWDQNTGKAYSWLNMVERFFRDLTENRLRRSAFRSVEELIGAIDQYIDCHNENRKPFIWTAKADDILEKVKRARAVLHNRPSA